MRFKHYGKTLQLRIENAADLRAVLDLDESFWVATSAPVSVFRCDSNFIKLMDSNSDGRINTREVENAITWMLDRLNDDSKVAADSDSIPLKAICDSSAEGRDLIEVAHHIHKALGIPEESVASLSAVHHFLDHLRKQPMNGDGVITVEAASSPEVAQYIKDVVACTGGTLDAGGEQGVNASNISAFQDSVAAYLDWQECGLLVPEKSSSNLFPFGEDTAKIYDVCQLQADKVDLFFALCRTIDFEPRAKDLLGCSDTELKDFDFTKPEDLNSCLECAPIAKPTADGRLPLDSGVVNPLYRNWFEDLCNIVLAPVVGDVPEFLTEDEWTQVKKSLKPYSDYLKGKPQAGVGKLEHKELLEYRSGNLAAEAYKLVEHDKQVTEILNKTHTLEKLLLYHKHLVRFTNNFVNFSQLYEVDERAMFEMGSAVIDGRWFNMALKVDDVSVHEKIAKSSNIFVLYAEVKAEESDRKFTVAIPATSGTRGNLSVGKRGIFIDIDGNEYNAQVIKIIKNPISIREGVVAPFVRLWDFIIGKIEGISGASEKELQKKTDALLKAPTAAGGVPGGPAAILVGLSVSAAAIGSSFAFITKTLSDLSPQQVVLGLLGAVLFISAPVVLLAVIKLNRQDLSSLLEGCGWAINARMRFDRAQRHQFTLKKDCPGEITGLPYKYRWVILLAVLLIVIAFYVFSLS